MLHQSGLVIAGVPGQGKQLLKRRWERKQKEFMAALSNVLAIRFKGIDPERLLNWLYPKVGWFFSQHGRIFLPAAVRLRTFAGARAVRHVPRPAAGVPPVLWS